MENLPTIDELMQQACDVRDEDQPSANTARRVGSVLAGLVSALSASYPFSSASVRTTPQGMSIEYSVLRPDGTPESTMSLDLPPATADTTGLLTAADKAQIDRTARTVDIGALDAMLEGKGPSDLSEIVKLLGEWTVTAAFPVGPLVVGRLLMFTDNDRHQVTQELHSNYREDLAGHNDSRVNVIHRAYGLSRGDGSVPVGAFTPWSYVTAPPATTSTDGSMSAADKALLEHILDIGDFASKDAACAYAARAEVAGNKQAALIIFHATGATGAKLEGRILQMVNGENTSMQILLWDKRLFRRNVTGATGREGDATNAFPLEQMGVMKMDYSTAAHQLNLKSYENDVIATAEIPTVTTTRPGLMPYSEYIVFLDLKDRIADLERRVAALESAGA